MLKKIDARYHMTKNPVTFKADTDIFEAISVMLEKKISGATVLDDEKRVVGVISEFDCLKAILSGSYYEQVGGTVGEFMTAEVEVVSKDMDILKVAERLINGKRRRLPIVEDGKFIGQYSIRSILNAVRDFNRK